MYAEFAPHSPRIAQTDPRYWFRNAGKMHVQGTQRINNPLLRALMATSPSKGPFLS